jgi:hypothetical protein
MLRFVEVPLPPSSPSPPPAAKQLLIWHNIGTHRQEQYEYKNICICRKQLLYQHIGKKNISVYRTTTPVIHMFSCSLFLVGGDPATDSQYPCDPHVQVLPVPGGKGPRHRLPVSL